MESQSNAESQKARENILKAALKGPKTRAGTKQLATSTVVEEDDSEGSEGDRSDNPTNKTEGQHNKTVITLEDFNMDDGDDSETGSKKKGMSPIFNEKSSSES
ncbi:uncharacterized protein MELLADRAFT_108866 [Melampsora larici-populina 98AG31]|uniref:Uncharacterized protein n=1 Tax=Melampsora larici-populina (strain 98AG31 / pathotype 3-4-7) TaxID=747676 RepID=F4RUJ1_MELLP|nr:uncharacterized protein MELLADRAFT_108866 [Melampsora larici-populina 98AG31]EGG03990.1 hypothetical protein MELLADRAFT_108866 [Melampsora larici-populina 98AG31]